jgi:glycosyltransferase involved in cell wall biosynthesis
LNVGLIEPRKNLLRLVEAYESASDLRDYSLVLAGGLGWDYEPLLRHINESAAKSRILLPGYIHDDDLPALYSLAVAFAYPSLYEGFGLPVLEAMACGTPVVTSNVSSLPEVVGDAGLLVDPQSVGELSESLRRVLAHADLAADLRRRGRERAWRFSWHSTAQKTLDVYRVAAGA